MKKKRKDKTWVWVTLLIVVALVVGYLQHGANQSDSTIHAGFADATPLGGKGLRLVLENLGYTVKRQTDPLQAMPGDAKVWLILDPDTRFTKPEAQQLLAWVRQGGVLLFCLRPTNFFSFATAQSSEGIETLHESLGIDPGPYTMVQQTGLLPTLTPLDLDAVSVYRTGVKKASGSNRTFTVSRPHLEIAGEPGSNIKRVDLERGRIFVIADALLFTNYALSKDDNAAFVTNLLRVHALKGSVYFDERNHGKNSVSAPGAATLITYLKQPPVSYAIWQLLIAGLLIWSFASRRLGAPVPLPGSGPVTRASQFAAAMGALFSKTNRPKAASTVIGTRFRRRLAQRLGLSPAESDVVLAKRAQEVGGIPFDVTDRLLLQSRAPATTVAEALRDAQQMEAVLRQLEGKS